MMEWDKKIRNGNDEYGPRFVNSFLYPSFARMAKSCRTYCLVS
jgi:hypothetical protein